MDRQFGAGGRDLQLHSFSDCFRSGKFAVYSFSGNHSQPMTPENWIHIVEALAIVLSSAVAVLSARREAKSTRDAMTQRFDRFLGLQKDFPPHRHIPGDGIIYPRDYQPAHIQDTGEA